MSTNNGLATWVGECWMLKVGRDMESRSERSRGMGIFKSSSFNLGSSWVLKGGLVEVASSRTMMASRTAARGIEAITSGGGGSGPKRVWCRRWEIWI
jgi:hypothetical protein